MRAVGFIVQHGPPATSGGNGQRTQPSADSVRAYCNAQGHQLAGLFTPADGESERAAYARMTAGFRGITARPALVIVPDATHLAPDLEEFAARLLELRSLGCDVKCVDRDVPDIVLNAIEHLGLHGPANMRDKRVRRSVLAKASRGESLGRTPFGYAAGIDGVLHPVPAEAKIVREIFRWYTGHAESGVVTTTRAVGAAVQKQEVIGLRQVARRLNDRGDRTRQGRPWTPVALANILRNRAYLGHYSRYGVWIVGAHEALIDKGMFNLAQSIIMGRKPVRGLRHAEPFPLGGMLSCGVCGEGVFGITRRRSWKRHDGTPRTEAYRYYACRARPPRGGPKGDDHPSWRAEDLESAVRNADANFYVPQLSSRPASASGGRRALVNAERDFMQQFRAVASGKLRTESLQSALAALRSARRTGSPESDASAGDTQGTGTHEVLGLAPASSHRKVIVHRDRVEVVPAS